MPRSNPEFGRTCAHHLRNSGQRPVDLDGVDLICIGPLPSYVWYESMADFAERISDEPAGRRLARAIQGKGAFRRFKNELHQEYPQLLLVWADVPAKRRGVEWLVDNSLVDKDTPARFLTQIQTCPDPRTPAGSDLEDWDAHICHCQRALLDVGT
jgi:hypothetical protein